MAIASLKTALPGSAETDALPAPYHALEETRRPFAADLVAHKLRQVSR